MTVHSDGAIYSLSYLFLGKIAFDINFYVSCGFSRTFPSPNPLNASNKSLSAKKSSLAILKSVLSHCVIMPNLNTLGQFPVTYSDLNRYICLTACTFVNNKEIRKSTKAVTFLVAPYI